MSAFSAPTAGTKRKQPPCEHCWQQESIGTGSVCVLRARVCAATCRQPTEKGTPLTAHANCMCPLPACTRCVTARKRDDPMRCYGCDEKVLGIVVLGERRYRSAAKRFCEKNGARKSDRKCRACMRPQSVWARHVLCSASNIGMSAGRAGDTGVCYRCATEKSWPWCCAACDAQLDETQVLPARFFH